VFKAAKPKLANICHVLLLGTASDDDVMVATRRAYTGRVEMGTDLAVIEITDKINILHLH
jgi:hypothetical protein